MTLSLVGYISGNSGTPANFNISLPGGSAAGDKIVGASVGDLTDTALPSGFTGLDFAADADTAEIRSFHKTLDATDISNGFVTVPGDPGFNGIYYMLWVWHSTNGTPTIDGHSARQASDLTSPTVYNSGTITTTSANDGVCVAMGGRPGAGTAWSSTPGGVTIDENSPTGHLHRIAWHYTFAGPGTTTDQTASYDAANDREHAAVIGVADAAGAPSTFYIRQAAMRVG